MVNEKNVTTCIVLPKVLNETLNEFADATNLSKGAIIRKALLLWFNTYKYTPDGYIQKKDNNIMNLVNGGKYE